VVVAGDGDRVEGAEGEGDLQADPLESSVVQHVHDDGLGRPLNILCEM
jgi:hypothetical protein